MMMALNTLNRRATASREFRSCGHGNNKAAGGGRLSNREHGGGGGRVGEGVSRATGGRGNRA